MTVRLARPDEYAALAEHYAAWGYDGGIATSDVVLLAEEQTAPVGIVRQTIEHGILMLRGMYVDPHAHRRGIGSALLRAFVERLDGDAKLRSQPCYGIPFVHLEQFYARGGFRFIDEATAPEFLRQRLAHYRTIGRGMTIMKREAPRADTREVVAR